jgi:hypothetical protein
MSKIVGMTMSEIERASIIRALDKGDIKPQVAALRLAMTTRQVRRLAQCFRNEGASGLMSQRRGKASNHQLDAGLAQRALELLREHYSDFGPTLAAEKLQQRHGLTLSKETVRKIMMKDGLWRTRDQRKATVRQLRPPRANFGDLVQIDGSPHDWFEDRGPACTLLVFVDDATSNILQLYFATTESTASYFTATNRYIVQHGKPNAFYADRAAIFRSPSGAQIVTQFHRAVKELDIELICANSPEGKGRVERMNKTLQDRLVKELRLDGISTIDEANAWSGPFIKAQNERFAVVARDGLNLHRPASAEEDLDVVLTWQDKRKVSARLSLQYEGATHVLRDTSMARQCMGKFAVVHKYRCGRIEIRYDGEVLQHTTMGVRVKAGRPIEVDSKSINSVVDAIHMPPTPVPKTRARAYRVHTGPGTAKGVAAAKALSVKKRPLLNKRDRHPDS